MRVDDIVEYDEYLKKYIKKEALVLRIKNRLNLPFRGVSYYPFGLYASVFSLDPNESDIKTAIRDIVPDAKVSVERGRISVTTVDVSLEV